MTGEDLYNAWKTAMHAHNKKQGGGSPPAWQFVRAPMKRMWNETARLTHGVEIRYVLAIHEDYEGIDFREDGTDSDPLTSYETREDADAAAKSQKIPKKDRAILAIQVEV